MKHQPLSIIILTYNEEIHIERCIKSLQPVAKNIFIVDSFSTDKTVEVAESMGAKVFQNPWKNYADQFQWGIDNCPIDTEWVMRMDADEFVEPDLVEEIQNDLVSVAQDISGIYIRRKQFFLGKWIKHGDRYPLYLLRFWRSGVGRIEQRWMDEHIVLESGATMHFKGHFVDDNKNSTSWFIEKHNKYADREMIDILSRKYNLFQQDEQLLASDDPQAKKKRKIKEGIYNKMPIFIRPILYFLYRYFLRLGFLDGVRGTAYHLMQGFWYRALVDLRVYEAELKINNLENKEEIKKILRDLTGLQL